MGKKYFTVLKIWKGEYNQCLDVVRSLPIVPCSPHNFFSRDSETNNLSWQIKSQSYKNYSSSHQRLANSIQLSPWELFSFYKLKRIVWWGEDDTMRSWMWLISKPIGGYLTLEEMSTCKDPCQVRQVMATKHTLWIHANMTQIWT